LSLATVLLAAGRSSRMRGRDKLLEEIAGAPLLRRMVERVLAAHIGPLAVTLPPHSSDRDACLASFPIERLRIADASEGLSASLRRAARWAKDIEACGLMICPADMPDLTQDDFEQMARSFNANGPPIRATSITGKPGHPVVFPARYLHEFSDLSGDAGANVLLRKYPPDPIALPGTHATTDLDTPEDWSRWREASGQPGSET
jgi:molybdenum cofactor cytidylyltransferase